MPKPRLLDLFCGAGGATMGYAQAGFEVVGVDSVPQPRYPFEFHQADAFNVPLEGFDAIHASPPCQGYSAALRDKSDPKPLLIGAVRSLLESARVPYIIENVTPGYWVSGSELINGILLCGSMFGLPIWRHRLFETNPPLLPLLACRHYEVPRPLNFYNTKSRHRDGISGKTDPRVKAGFEIDWMTGEELTEAIPPAFTRYIGQRFLQESIVHA